jgi:Sensors of blue-light using FAD
MLSLVYVSSANQAFSDGDLMVLLQQSREKNERLRITGMLLYKDGNFMQVLEGPDDAVTPLYATIESDFRHHGLIELLRRPIQAREFPSWSMGFQKLRDVDLQQTPGYSTFLNEPLNSRGFQSDPTRAQKLLAVFRDKI